MGKNAPDFMVTSQLGEPLTYKSMKDVVKDQRVSRDTEETYYRNKYKTINQNSNKEDVEQILNQIEEHLGGNTKVDMYARKNIWNTLLQK